MSTVELPGFKDIIVGLQPNRTVLCRATMKMRFDEMVCAMKGNIRDTLCPLSFVATTSDCWTAHRRSYIEVTVHWIDPETLKRIWAAMACRRLRGSHTFDVLDAVLEDVNEKYGFSQKRHSTHLHRKFANYLKKYFSVSLTKEVDMELDTYSAYVQNMTIVDRNSYLKKLFLQNGTRLPDPHSTTICDWSTDITKLPDVNWMDIQTYLIDKPSEFTKDSLKAWRSLDYYVCGHVQDCFYDGIS